MRVFLILIFSILCGTVWSQSYLMTQQNHGTTIETCSGTFYDDGGPNGNYSSNINNRTITFRPSDSSRLLKFVFNSFHVELNYDKLEVFFGATATGTPDLTFSGNLPAFTVISPTIGQEVTFRFKSDFSVEYAGWAATISCVEPCSAPVAAIAGPNVYEFCPSSAENNDDFTVSLDASDSYSTDNHSIIGYIWDWGNGDVTETTTPIGTYTYDGEPGFYQVSLKVKTNNFDIDPEGCFSKNLALKTVKITPPPDFSQMSDEPIEISCGDSVELTGIGASQTITQQPPVGFGSDMVLPDTQNTAFLSSIDLDGYFPDGAKVTASCLPEIIINLEHSYAGDLKIFLVAPSGQEVIVMDGYANGPGSGNLGKRLFGYCVNNSDGTGPGCPAPYHIVNSGGFNWNAANAIHSYTEACDAFSNCYSSDQYFKQGETFNSSQSYNNFIGEDLNGIWTLKIIDYWGVDDGYSDGWSISFPGQCYIDLETETPILDGGVWTHTGTGPSVPTNQNIINEPHVTTGIDDCPGDVDCIGNQLTNSIIVGPFTETGSFVYTFTIIDEFGCEFVKNIEINVGEVEVKFSNLEDTYCVDEEPSELSEISDNGVSGVWFPNEIETSTPGDFTYTFTPDEGQCAEPITFNVSVIQWDLPSFDLPMELCEGTDSIPLPNNSLEGLSGSWLPATIVADEVGTFTYVFTPEDECVETITIEVEILSLVQLSFNPIDPLCQNSEAPMLPDPNEAYTGTWSPAIIDTSEPGTYTYTFTPEDDCADNATIEITIEEEIIPEFVLQHEYCQWEEPQDLLVISDNGYEGTWSPAVIDTSAPGTYTYTFTPNDTDCFQAFSIDIEIGETIFPTFEALAPLCQFSEAPALPQPNEGITGTWFPATIDTSVEGTFEFTFTPDMECSEPVTIQVDITGEINPIFALPNGYCQFETPETLDTVSNNGVVGTWFPTTIDTSTPGTYSFTFTPEDGLCSNEFSLIVEVFEQPILNSAPVQYLCDDDFDGTYETNLNTLSPILGGGNVNYTFFASLADFNNDLPIPGGQWNNYTITDLPKTIYVIGTSAQGCDSEPKAIVFAEGPIVQHNPGPFSPIDYCPEDSVDLTQYEGIISSANSVDFKYYNTLNDARFETGVIGSPTNFNPSNNQTSVFVRLNSDDYCSAIVEIILNRLPSPELSLLNNAIICPGDEFEVTATSDFENATFVWTLEDGTEWYGATQIITEIGNYSVTAYSEDGCRSQTETLTIQNPTTPTIISVEVTGNSIVVGATNNGEGAMEYSLDKILWQSSNRFDNLIPGEDYTVWVRSSGCMMASYDVTMLSVPNFISPNGDGKNDTWLVRGLNPNSVGTIKIFDRYGKIFVDRTFQGSFEWDGQYMGRSVASGDYWYIINIPGDGIVADKKFTGHISVRNQ